MGTSGNKDIKVIWFDEQINNEENKNFFNQVKPFFHKCEKYERLEEGFNNFYHINNEDDFKIIIVIVSGKLFGRYIKKIKNNINKIINIPYTYIFTSENYRKVLMKLVPDKEHILSYDTMIALNNSFYNPGGIYDDFDILLKEMKKLNEKIVSKVKINRIRQDKINYEGILNFEYLENEEELLAPALYKDIITNEKITKEDCKNFHKFILTYNEEQLNSLIKNLDLFEYIPFEILSKYWARCYTIESDFYKVLNNHLMKSKLSYNYKTFIKMLYTGVEINSLKSYSGKYLYRGSSINKKEIQRIKKYKNNGELSNVVVFSKAFLSFTENKDKAESFCGTWDDTKIGSLYILENNNINLHESNADIQNYSVFPEEKEILFFPGSSFIITNIDDNRDDIVIIKLKYNGKFKEKYSVIYEDQEKINNIINNNELTKIISGKKLCFLKNGKYLIEEKIGQGPFGEVFKGKDLKTDEVVAIKSRAKYRISKEKVMREVDNLKKLSDNIKNSCKLKDFFETKDYYYIILDFYDDNLLSFLRNNSKFPPNLIKKIFMQLNEHFKELIKLNNNRYRRTIKPNDILIRYNNEEKTNFDSVLLGILFNKEDDIKFPIIFNLNSILYNIIEFIPPELLKEGKPYNNTELYSIGITIYFLYFGKHPYYRNNGETRITLLNEIKNFNDNLEEIIKIEEDKELEDLLIKLLKENPDERITWIDYFNHPFFKQYEY